MDETEVFALNLLQPLRKIALWVFWIKRVLEIIRDIEFRLSSSFQESLFIFSTP
jgi:hypothetical protein